MIFLCCQACSDSATRADVTGGGDHGVDDADDDGSCITADVDHCETLSHCVISEVESTDGSFAPVRTCVSKEDCRDASGGEYVETDGGRCARVVSSCVDPDLRASDCGPSIDCSKLGPTDCATHDGCVEVPADRITPEACYVEDFGTCISTDAGCNNLILIEQAPDGTCWRFLSGCTPSKWGSDELTYAEECETAFDAAEACE